MTNWQKVLLSNFLFLGVPSSLGTFTCRLISNGLPRMPAVVPPTRLAQGREQGSNRQEWGGRERRMDRGPWYPPQRDLLVLSALMTTWTESQGTISPRIIKAKDTTSNMAICTFQSSTNLTLARLTNMYTATAFFLSPLPSSSFFFPPSLLNHYPYIPIFFHRSPTVLEDEEPVMVLSNASSSPRLTQRPISLDSASGDELTSGSASGGRRSQNGGECM